MAEFAFAKTSGTVVRDRETNWPIAVRRFPSNDIRHNFGTHFGSTFLIVSWRIQVAITYSKCGANRVYYGVFENTKKRKAYGANWFPWSLFRHPRILRQIHQYSRSSMTSHKLKNTLKAKEKESSTRTNFDNQSSLHCHCLLIPGLLLYMAYTGMSRWTGNVFCLLCL